MDFYNNNDDCLRYFRPNNPAPVSDMFYYNGMGSGYGAQNPFEYGSRRYDGYPVSGQMPEYTSAPTQQEIPGSRRNQVGGLNNGIFQSSAAAYSAPIASPDGITGYTPQQVPVLYGQRPVNSVNVPPYTVNGFSNMFTQPPVPQAPAINWGNVDPHVPAYDYANYNQGGGYTYNPTFPAAEESWVDIAKNNIMMSDKL